MVTVGSDRCALLLDDVVEVLPAALLSPLPGAPRLVDGVLEVRGTVIPVIDLGRRLGHPPAPLSIHQRFVVVRANGRRLALRVDAAELESVPAEAIREPAPEAVGALGFVVLDDGIIAIRDVEQFLSAEEDAELERALAEVRGSR